MGQPKPQIQAAGGLIVRDDGKICLAHRPHYEDWSLPKGKVDDGESSEQAALREVQEEVGLRCRLEEELPSAYYYAGGGRTKTVRWWRMTPVQDLGFTANDEVDRRKWCRPHKALQRLTYEHDRQLVSMVFADELRERARR